MLSAFLMGLAGGAAASAHCAGMCGAFPLHLARSSQRAPVWVRLLLYVTGKAFTYAFLGALAGALGSGLVRSGLLPSSQKALAILAGAVILLFGLGMVGVKLPSLGHRFNAYDWGFVRSVYSHFFAHPGPASSFSLGLANGFLPCPITLAMLGMAAGSQSVAKGIVLMLGVGAGTVPVLAAVGAFGGLVNARWRRVGLRPAGVVVIVLGLMTILRTQELMHRGCHAGAGAPCCSHSEEASP